MKPAALTIVSSALVRRCSCVMAALALWLPAAKGLAHDLTLHQHDAARDGVEARLLALGVGLSMLIPLPPAELPVCRVTLKMVDADQPVPGLVRVTRVDGKAVPLSGLVSRGVGLTPNHPGRDWFALLESAVVALPREKLRIEGFFGIESELARVELDLTGKETATTVLAPRRFANPRREGWRAGNTHLHLRGLSRRQADEYMTAVSRADALELLFVSYARRPSQDRTYITNGHTPEQVRALSGNGVQFGWGEEHRNNFGPGDEGYGHVLLLNLRKLIEPVSIGPGIMDAGHDFPPLRKGMDEARREGGTVIWCHNTFGFEDVPDWLAGRIHAHNIFDGGTRGSYADSYYRFLNVGLRVPFSTGTDWFIYDFSRVYVRMSEEPKEANWLAGLAAGRTFITNGPLLELKAGDHEIGDVVKLDHAGTLQVKGRATGRSDFKSIELVHNGAVIAQAQSRAVAGHFEAELEFPLRADAPGWVALRVTSRSVAGPPPAPSPPGVPPPTPVGGNEPRNELGEVLFAHTSPIYLDLAGRRAFQPEAARSLIADLEAAEVAIRAKGQFADEAQREEVLAIYRQGVVHLKKQLEEHAP